MKFLKSILLATVVSITFNSCGDDDDVATVAAGGTGSIVYDGTTYPLSQGFLINYGADTTTNPVLYNYDIVLYSNDFNFDLANQTATGVGTNVYLELWSTQATGLKNGTYTYVNGVATDLSFTNGFIGLDFNIQTGDGRIEDDVNSGTAVLTIDNTRVDLTFTFTTDLGETVTGSYSGNLTAIDES
jgi:hypothetical protein